MSDISPSVFDRLSGYINKDVVKWACGIGAAAFVGYAVYYDYCRTHAPDYKQKIRESRWTLFVNDIF
jgi:hypothetical protein